MIVINLQRMLKLSDNLPKRLINSGEVFGYRPWLNKQLKMKKKKCYLKKIGTRKITFN